MQAETNAKPNPNYAIAVKNIPNIENPHVKLTLEKIGNFKLEKPKRVDLVDCLEVNLAYKIYKTKINCNNEMKFNYNNMI